MSSFVPNADGLAMLEAMGMATKKCIKALKETDNNVERAVDWIFRSAFLQVFSCYLKHKLENFIGVQ